METLLTLIPSVCWILYRCIQILKTPVKELIEDLNIEIPHSPNVCIDSITKNSAIIHWDIEIKLDENLYYILVINNQEVATITSTSCKLNNLDPEHVYQIQIIVVNSLTNFRSQSSPIYIETMENSGDLNELEGEIGKTTSPITNTETIQTFAPHGIDIESINIDTVKSTTSSEQLNGYLIGFQNETIKLNQEFKSYQNHVSEESKNLHKQFKIHKREFDEETDNRLKKDNEVKVLERNKDKLNYQKLKLTNHLNSLKSGLELYQSKIDVLVQKHKKLSERNAQLLKGEQAEKEKIASETATIQAQIEKVKKDNEKVEENLKVLMAEKKEHTTIMNQLKPLLDELNTPLPSTNGTVSATGESAVFNKDGIINRKAFDTLYKIFKILPLWEEEITNEINTYQLAEVQWREDFKAEIKKYLSYHQTLEVLKQNRDKSYQPVKLSEYQVSIDFGGFSNALPKPKFNGNSGKGFRNFSPEENAGSFYNHYSSVYSNEGDSNLDQNDTQPVGVDRVAPGGSGLSGLNNTVQNTVQNVQNTVGRVNGIENQYSSPSLVNNMLTSELEMPQPLFGQNFNSTLPQGFPYDDQIYTSNIKSPIQETSPMYRGYDLNPMLYAYNSPRISTPSLNGAATVGGQPGVGRGAGVWGSGVNDLFSANDSLTSLPGVGGGVAGVSAGVNPGVNPSINGVVGVNTPPGATPESGYLLAPKLWMDGDMGTSGSIMSEPNPTHARNVSSSQIWRDHPSTHNFHLGMAEFQPFDSSANLSGVSINAPNGNGSTPHKGAVGANGNGNTNPVDLSNGFYNQLDFSNPHFESGDYKQY